MATRRISALTEYDAQPAADDLLYMVDASNKADGPSGTSRKIKAQRFAVTTDGLSVNFTGGGTIALGGFNIIVPNTPTGINKRAVTCTDGKYLSNKTWTTPVIGDFSNAQHTHTDASEGGLINIAPAGYISLFRGLHYPNLIAPSAINQPAVAKSDGQPGDLIPFTTVWINSDKILAQTVKLRVYIQPPAGAVTSIGLFAFTDWQSPGTPIVYCADTVGDNTQLVESADFLSLMPSGLAGYALSFSINTPPGGDAYIYSAGLVID